MNRVLAALAAGLIAGTLAAAYAELPPPTPEEKAAAEAKKEKDAAAKTKAAAGASTPPASPQGADHSDGRSPDSELTREEAQTGMPKAGQVNDYSTPNRDPQNSSPAR